MQFNAEDRQGDWCLGAKYLTRRGWRARINVNAFEPPQGALNPLFYGVNKAI